MTYEECRLELEKILNRDVFLLHDDNDKYVYHLHERGCCIIAGILKYKTYSIDTTYDAFDALGDNLKRYVLLALVELARAPPKNRIKKQECDKSTNENIKNEFNTLSRSLNTTKKLKDILFVATPQDEVLYAKIKNVLTDKNSGLTFYSDKNCEDAVEEVFKSMKAFDEQYWLYKL